MIVGKRLARRAGRVSSRHAGQVFSFSRCDVTMLPSGVSRWTLVGQVKIEPADGWRIIHNASSPSGR